MHPRKTELIRERIETDELGAPCAPLVRVAALAVLRNPFAGIDQDELSTLFEIAAILGERLASEALAALGAAPVTYGKAATVGTMGASEHRRRAAAHPDLRQR